MRWALLLTHIYRGGNRGSEARKATQITPKWLAEPVCPRRWAAALVSPTPGRPPSFTVRSCLPDLLTPLDFSVGQPEMIAVGTESPSSRKQPNRLDPCHCLPCPEPVLTSSFALGTVQVFTRSTEQRGTEVHAGPAFPSGRRAQTQPPLPGSHVELTRSCFTFP